MIVNFTKDIHIEECVNCGVPFGISMTLHDRFKKTRESFYCPFGHGQHYTGQNEEERLNQRVRELVEEKEVLKQELAAKPKRGRRPKVQ